MVRLQKGAGGHLIRNANGHLVNACVSPPDPVVCGDLAAVYRLVDYLDGDIPACPDCFNSGNPAWDGTFVIDPLRDPCDRLAGTTATHLSIDGKVLDAATTWLNFPDWMAPPTFYWELLIRCNPFIGSEVVWRGRKYTGSNPAATYTRVLGCDTTATLEIESVP